jgi:prevent-host-death family protein
MKTITLTEARNQLLKLANDIEKNPGTVVEVVKRGRPVLTLMSSELYESIVETLEVLRDPPTTTKLRQALREIEQGKGIPWETAKERLGL